MYLTLWTLRVTPVYVYRHFSRWLRTRGNPAGTRKVATLPRVPAFDHANPWEGLRVAPKMCNFSSRSVARPRQSIVIFDTSRRTVGKKNNFTSRSCVRPCHSMGRVARHAENVQLYLAFSRSTTPIHCNFRYVAPNGWKKMQLYLAFVRSTMPIHGKGCAWRRQGAILRRVRALDHANPW